MKKLALTFVFAIFAMALGFKSIASPPGDIAPYHIPSQYTLIVYNLGTIYIQEGKPYTLTVNYSGDYVGKSESFRLGSGNSFIWWDTFSADGINYGCFSLEGNCHSTSYSHIGDVYTMQGGQFVIYQILATVVAQ